jgi:hypothetical protein
MAEVGIVHIAVVIVIIVVIFAIKLLAGFVM